MRSYLFAALAATVAAAPSPVRDLLPRQQVCTPPGTTNGLTGPFKITIGSNANPAYAGNYAGTIPKRVPYIVFQYKNPTSSMVGDFYLDGNNNLLLIQNDVTSYAFYQVPPRYVSLSTDAGVANKITCTISPTTCELDCVTPNGKSTDCLGSPKVSPEWKIGGPNVVKPGCPAFTPVIVADTAVSDPLVTVAGVNIGQ